MTQAILTTNPLKEAKVEETTSSTPPPAAPRNHTPAWGEEDGPFGPIFSSPWGAAEGITAF